MKSVADVNLLLPILHSGHSQHALAWNWWAQRPDDSVGLTLPTRLGVLRLLSNSAVMQGKALTPSEALGVWSRLAGDARCVWVEPAPGHEAIFAQFVTGRSPSPNLWTDAWLAATAESHGCTLSSFDRDFGRFGLTHFELLGG